MLSKIFRLPAQISFQNARRFQSPFFIVSATKNDLPTSRYGFIVSKKIDKRAVVRNRVKRLVRSVVEQDWLEKNMGQDVLFVLRPAIKDAIAEDIRREVRLVMEKCGAL